MSLDRNKNHRHAPDWGWIFFWALLVAFGFLLSDTKYLLKRLKEAEQPAIVRRGCVQVEFSDDGKYWTPQDRTGAPLPLIRLHNTCSGIAVRVDEKADAKAPMHKIRGPAEGESPEDMREHRDRKLQGRPTPL